MKNYQAHSPQNLALTKIFRKFKKTSTSQDFQDGSGVPIPKIRMEIYDFGHFLPQIHEIEKN